MENINPIIADILLQVDPHSYCPLCKLGDKESQKIRVCENCAKKFKTLKNKNYEQK